MKRFLLLILGTILMAGTIYFGYSKVARYMKQRPVADAENLRRQIISSIRNPFPQSDTLILETQWMFCGNSDPDQLPIVFDTKLEDYKEALSRQAHVTVLTMTEFHKVMDKVSKTRFDDEYNPHLWDLCRMNKVATEIVAEQLSPRKVKLYENYRYNDAMKYVRKEFTFDHGAWTWQVTDTLVQITAQNGASQAARLIKE